MAGRVKTQTFNKLAGVEAPVVKRKRYDDISPLLFSYPLFSFLSFLIICN